MSASLVGFILGLQAATRVVGGPRGNQFYILWDGPFNIFLLGFIGFHLEKRGRRWSLVVLFCVRSGDYCTLVMIIMSLLDHTKAKDWHSFVNSNGTILSVVIICSTTKGCAAVLVTVFNDSF